MEIIIEEIDSLGGAAIVIVHHGCLGSRILRIFVVRDIFIRYQCICSEDVIIVLTRVHVLCRSDGYRRFGGPVVQVVIYGT
jgi:hypothetical protein